MKKRNIGYIELIVCAVRGITPEALQTRTRNREVVETRQLVFCFALDCGHTQWGVARYYQREHATVISGSKHICDIIDTEKSVRDEYEIMKFVIDDDDLYLSYLKKMAKDRLHSALSDSMSVEELERVAR